MAEPLFACTNCHVRFPFNKLSGSKMLCKMCSSLKTKNSGITACTYCREEYHQNNTDESSASACPKCLQNVKLHGKPRACEVCNIVAAFIGNRCQRCTISEKKWGSPVQCEQCKQKCAFVRDEKQNVDSKTLCWLCTIAYKRVLAKARKVDNSLLFGAVKPADSSLKRKSADKVNSSTKPTRSEGNQPSAKRLSIDTYSASPLSLSRWSADGPISDMNIVLVSQLMEEVETLKKSSVQKDQQLREKDVKITEIKALQMDNEKVSRQKIQILHQQHAAAMDNLQRKNNDLLKQLAAATRGKKASSAAGSTNGQSGSPVPV